MLYKKNGEKQLSDELFQNPTAEYRGTPFWAWNCKLSQDRLNRQLDKLKEMGFGGAHMHVRSGMSTEYLSDEFMGYIKGCVEHCKAHNMLAWLYDEDRWPSGAAGGLVTKDKKYAMRHLLVTPSDLPVGEDKTSAIEKGEHYFLAAYDVCLDAQGILRSYRRIGRKDAAEGTKWYAFSERRADDPWFNNQPYLNMMDNASVRRFIEVTHERYKEVIAEDFGETVPAIFTDEPQLIRGKYILFADGAMQTEDLRLPFTDDMPETFKAYCGYDLLEILPEILWISNSEKHREYKYHYINHMTERFVSAFGDQIGAWCKENHIAFTGHVMREPKLYGQTTAVGEAMRFYRSMDLPGIDMLCNYTEFTTAKQCQSAVRQYGREGMMSELYGVTSWKFDFRGHKFQGDWQAAMGVTVRVPHLAWVSMKGEAKRDYPAAIGYQSPWYKEYKFMEDHFARVATAMTRGTPIVQVGVIHPIESSWVLQGPWDQCGGALTSLDQKFADITYWLSSGQIDFDYISEALLPSLETDEAGVGKMQYKMILVPCCITLRSSTLRFLEKFVKKGGKVVFVGDCPSFVDAKPSDAVRTLYAQSRHVDVDREEIVAALEDARLVDMRYDNRYAGENVLSTVGASADRNSSAIRLVGEGSRHDNLVYQMRQDGADRWLFVAHLKETKGKDCINDEKENICFTVQGTFYPILYNTLDGGITPLSYTHQNGKTVFYKKVNTHDSVLVKLSAEKTEISADPQEKVQLISSLRYKKPVTYKREEPNVLLLETAEFKLDDGDWQEETEILVLDNICRGKLGWQLRREKWPQPWTTPDDRYEHKVTLRMTFQSDIAVDATLAIEDADIIGITLNGQKVKNDIIGYFVDEDIHKVALPTLAVGENVLEVEVPYNKRSNLEWCYILGEFDVWTAGCNKKIVAKSDTICFDAITHQGLPFYGGNLQYFFDVEVPEEGASMQIRVPHYRCALVTASVDGGEAQRIVFTPYDAHFKNLSKGVHQVCLTLFGNRNNTFAPLHMTDDGLPKYMDPNSWRTTVDSWSDTYQLENTGIIDSPTITFYK